MPHSIKRYLKKAKLLPKFKEYSENLLIYPGSSDINIFDLDQERWLISNNQLPKYKHPLKIKQEEPKKFDY